MTVEATRSKVVRTSCGQCYIGCAIEVTVDDGVVTNLSGNPASPQNRGKMCAKGKAGIMNLYNPNRVKVPLKRTNPGKGMDVDPGWVEITWEEAIDTIVRQLERIRDTPKKLLIHSWEVMGDNLFWLSSFGNAFGAYLTAVVASPDCGKVVHPVEYFSGGGFHQQPDLHYANYCILVGTQLGVASRASFNHLLLDMANARERGMKLVVVDPVGGHAGSKANEWVPIRPGTDGAWGLGMLHVLLNELGIYDREFLADKTNSPYLVGPDGHYLRDRANGQPLVHDLVDGATKAHDDPSLKRAAINGTYAVDGTAGRTAFDLLREHVAKYPPEVVEKITTIPAATVRRMAREFGEAARIGETIEIDGVTLPYRPVCVDWAKGAQGHTHGFHNCWPLKLLNIVVGAVNVPGGILSTGAAGKFPHEWWPEAGTDGMLEHGGQIFPMGHPSSFPGRTPARPLRADIAELFPLAPHYHTLLPIVFDDPSKFGLQSGQAVEVMMHSPNNAILVVAGENRLTGQTRDAAVQTLAQVGNPVYEVPLGPTIPAYYGLVASRYMHEFGTTEEDLAELAVLMRRHASTHPGAQFRDTFTVADVLASKPVAAPLKLLDCCPVSDGGAAFLVSRERINDFSVRIRGTGQAHTHQHVTAAPSLTQFGAAACMERAKTAAGVTTRRDADGFGLTKREAEVLELIASGLGNAEIAARLARAEKTIRNQASSVFAKLGVATRAEAIVRARRAGFGGD